MTEDDKRLMIGGFVRELSAARQELGIYNARWKHLNHQIQDVARLTDADRLSVSDGRLSGTIRTAEHDGASDRHWPAESKVADVLARRDELKATIARLLEQLKQCGADLNGTVA